jgi:HEPN domain-containing protein
MKPLTKAWAVKAEADLATAQREVAVKDDPNYEGVCYHAKECALNYLKARLEEAEIPFPVTSHLVVLLELSLEVEPNWESFRDHLRFLTTSANQSLEPDSRTNRKTANQAVEMARAFRDEVRQGLITWAPAPKDA